MRKNIRYSPPESSSSGSGRNSQLTATATATATATITSLAKDLQSALEGEVKFDAGYRALYATDASNYRQVPIGVVFPKTKEDIIKAVAICNRYDVPILCRGGGTSLAGQCCNVAVILEFSKYYNRILDFNQEKKLVRVEPGLVLDDLRRAVEPHGLTFGPDPATHNHCTLGGMIGNNSCGVHSVSAAFEGDGARTGDFIEELEILTYDGNVFTVGKTSPEELQKILSSGNQQAEIYSRLKSLAENYEELIRKKYPKIPRRISGYNLDELIPDKIFNVARALAGTESTCVIILSATLQLIKFYKERSLVVIGYKDVYESAKHLTEILEHKPIGLEGVDDKLIGFMRKKGMHEESIESLPEGNGWLWVEFGGDTKEEAEEKARKLMESIAEPAGAVKLFLSSDDQKKIWKVRDSGLGATAFVPGLPDAWEGWEDAAVPVDKVSEYLLSFRKLLSKYHYDTTMYGHFGQGCVHCRINFDFRTKEGIEAYKNFTGEAADLVISLGGSLSGEHGDGQSRGELLYKMYGDELINAFREFKTIWDPKWKMNPGKIIDAYPRDSNLRLGEHHRDREVDTWFKYPDDHGNFSRATLRCVGVGECRKTDSGVMCPSYMATMDEKHSTRGRAHLLFEMMKGEAITDGWHDVHVKDSLDLCLACKGCMGECPVNVDVATYKAEFLAHYYQGKVRPRSSYTFGYINKWAQIASKMPGLINFMGHTFPFKNITKSIAGIAPQREIPLFAKRTFEKMITPKRFKTSSGLHSAVILWPDTFNNYFFPPTLLTAQKLLEQAGFEVIVPKRNFCCGRPLYDFGMLKKAKQYMEQILNGLSDEIQNEIPFVGLEPSCIAVFRNELINLYPNDDNAKKLSKNFFTLAEFIINHKENFKSLLKGQLGNGRMSAVLYHGHCHHKAVMHIDKDKQLLDLLGFDYKVLDAGCCGLAGSFGFERGDKYDVSMKAGERKLFPEIRQTDEQTLIIADGFSCREQILHGTGRKALHLAEALNLSMQV